MTLRKRHKNDAVNWAEEENLLDGLIGLGKGHSEGILEGKIEAARNAIELGIEPLKNSSITGLPLEEIQKLQAELSTRA